MVTKYSKKKKKLLFTKMFRFAKHLECSAKWVCDFANCTKCREERNSVVKIVPRQS